MSGEENQTKGYVLLLHLLSLINQQSSTSRPSAELLEEKMCSWLYRDSRNYRQRDGDELKWCRQLVQTMYVAFIIDRMAQDPVWVECHHKLRTTLDIKTMIQSTDRHANDFAFLAEVLEDCRTQPHSSILVVIKQYQQKHTKNVYPSAREDWLHEYMDIKRKRSLLVMQDSIYFEQDSQGSDDDPDTNWPRNVSRTLTSSKSGGHYVRMKRANIKSASLISSTSVRSFQPCSRQDCVLLRSLCISTARPLLERYNEDKDEDSMKRKQVCNYKLSFEAKQLLQCGDLHALVLDGSRLNTCKALSTMAKELASETGCMNKLHLMCPNPYSYDAMCAENTHNPQLQPPAELFKMRLDQLVSVTKHTQWGLIYLDYTVTWEHHKLSEWSPQKDMDLILSNNQVQPNAVFAITLSCRKRQNSQSFSKASEMRKSVSKMFNKHEYEHSMTECIEYKTMIFMLFTGVTKR